MRGITVKRFFIAVLILGIIGAGAFWALNNNGPDGIASNNQASNTGQNESADNEDQEQLPPTIIFSESGFTPENLTVEPGTTVTIVNNSPRNIDFASDDHPTHLLNPELNAGIILSGEMTEIIVNTTGSWGYHDHLDATQTGTITVE
jgi:plastocyanin